METLQQYKIDEEREQVLLQVISDKYCRQLLRLCLDKPKSAIEISKEGNIPISTVYRRLQTLHDNKLLGISGSISEDGKKYFLYRSKIKSITTSCDWDNVDIKVIPNTREI